MICQRKLQKDQGLDVQFFNQTKTIQVSSFWLLTLVDNELVIAESWILLRGGPRYAWEKLGVLVSIPHDPLRMDLCSMTASTRPRGRSLGKLFERPRT